MRSMSFMLTRQAVINRTKTVTRRLGWGNLKPGDRVHAVTKAMGLKKGEKQERLGVIEVVSVRREELRDISRDDVLREGFPGMFPDEFVAMFRRNMKCQPDAIVNRIEFRYVEDESC